MKKYLLILLLLCGFVGNAQYNLFARQNFAKSASAITYNTEIGGISATISTPALLATKLGIDVSRITNFTIVGSDIKCKITGSYAMPSNCWYGNNNITYYKDDDGLVSSLWQYSFANTTKLKYLKLHGLTSLTYYDIFSGTSCTKFKFPALINASDSNNARTFYGIPDGSKIYIPNATGIGTTSANNSIFSVANSSSRLKLYVNSSMATANSGSPEGDLTNAISQGHSVSYILNTTKPNAINDLTYANVYDTAVQLNFTVPSSTNTIEYYEVYINGIYNSDIQSSGQYLRGLPQLSSNSITVTAIDIYGNESDFSNPISVTTNTTPWLTNIALAAWKLDSNGVDSKNGYNGTVGSAVGFSTGVNGDRANFSNVTNSYISVPDNNALSFTDGTNDSPFSVSFSMNLNPLTSSTFAVPFGKNNIGGGTNDEWGLYIYGNQLSLILQDKSNSGIYLIARGVAPLAINTQYNIQFTYDGSKSIYGIKLYINGIQQDVSNVGSGVYSGMKNGTLPFTIGCSPNLGSRVVGWIDEVYIFNKELVKEEVLKLQSSYYPF